MENKRYSLLIIAIYCLPGHIKDIIIHLKAKNPLVDISLLTDKPYEYNNFLSDYEIKIYHYDVRPVDQIKIRRLRFYIIRHRQCKFFSRFYKNKRYDIINVHFPNRYMSYVIDSLRAMSNSIVISPWGSDLLRRDKIALDQLAVFYRKSDYITISSNSCSPIGNIILQDFKIDPKKCVGSFWGSDIVDYALTKGKTISQEESKRRFGLEGKYVITCGYNSVKEQRHQAIIEAIGQIKSQLPDNLVLLFPMTYGDISYIHKYIEILNKECRKRNLEAMFVSEHLSVEDLFKLRMSTDIFIHVQTTDAGARSVHEYILCDKKIVNGSWMGYKNLEAFEPLFYFPVSNMEDLGKVIVKAYQSPKINIPQEVFDIVNSRSWDNKITQMNNFFMSIV